MITIALGDHLGVEMAMDAWTVGLVAVTLIKQGREVVGAPRMLMS